MKVYVINVESKITGTVKTSQQGFTSLVAAKNYIKSRSDNPATITAYIYEGEHYIYQVMEININDNPLW